MLSLNDHPGWKRLSLSIWLMLAVVITGNGYWPGPNPPLAFAQEGATTTDYPQTIPVISIETDPLHLYWLHDYPEEHDQNEPRPVSLAYFAPGGQPQFTLNAGLRIYGGRSELYGPKKSYLVSFGQEYGGPGYLDYPLFPDTPVTRFKSLVLRAGNNDTLAFLNQPGLPATQAYFTRLIGDQVVRNLHRDMGQPAAHGSWVLLYLNGEFRGLYNLTEHVDQEFFRAYSGPATEWQVIGPEARRAENGEWLDQDVALAGRPDDWLALQGWIDSADLSNPARRAELAAAVDLENLFSYLFLQAYVQNYDWPGDGWIIYRRVDPAAAAAEGQWRVLVRNTGHSFGSGAAFTSAANTFSPLCSPSQGFTRLLSKSFSSGCDLKGDFAGQAREYLGRENLNGGPENQPGPLAKDRVRAELLRQAELVRPFIQLEIDRWLPGLSPDTFDQNIQNALTFIDEREDVLLRQLDNFRYQTFTGCK